MPGHDWQKSSFSGDASNCVNLASPSGGTILLRESDAPETVVTTTPAALRALLRAVKAGEFDHLTG